MSAAARVHGQGFSIMHAKDGSWVARCWDGRGVVVEIGMCMNRRQARLEAELEMDRMKENAR